MMKNDQRQQLLDLMRHRAVQRGEFTLASGEKSNFYFNSKMVQLHPEGAYLLGEVLYAFLEEEEFDALGGKAVGAVPLIAAFAVACRNHGRDVEGFFVRDQVKDHGTMQKVEGKLSSGDRVVIVDDVCTKGGSTMQAVRGAEGAGAKVMLVVSIVDRLQGGSEMIKQQGYRYRAVFTKDDLLEEKI